ncbi:phenylacetate--CoA ligase family protein [Desulfoluna spongiiphila]|uniref:phenylacetate--CoA ligase family protein n=1 Tax=Desulfoluna spongiiphila TaxID=419481 RepID=UPI001252B589|nr:phenylacetate--CoA ligase family protein [Desulfoluna spongiiphila]VVS94871.1 amp-dependent synthetase/ligase [Desulfoluna spongiiphila]
MTLRGITISAAARLFRPGLLSSYHSMLECESLSDEAIHELQVVKLKRLLCHHFGSWAYRGLCQHGPDDGDITELADLKKFPVVTKDFLRDYFDTAPCQNRAFRLNSTSGSSGLNLKFYQCDRMNDASSAAYRYCTQLAGVNAWGDHTIGIWGNSPSTDWRSNITLKAKQFLSNAQVLQGYGLDEKNALEYLEIIRRKRPRLLYGYPSYLHFVAHAGRINGIEAPEVGAIISSGEQVQSHHRQEIEAYFGKQLFNRYGSREFSVIAHETDSHRGMYVPPTRFVIETDSAGELLVTDLDNFATPFIRYAIGDMGQVVNARALLGRPGQCIESMHGRTHDTLWTPSGKLVPGQFLTILTKKVPGIHEFQFVQVSPDQIQLWMVVASEYDTTREHELTEYFNSSFGDEMSLVIHHTDRIQRTAMGKRRFIIRQENENAKA